MQAIGIVSLKNSSSWFTENVKLKIIGPLEFMCWLRSGFNVCFICRSNALSALFVIHDAKLPCILFYNTHVWWNATIPFSLTMIIVDDTTISSHQLFPHAIICVHSSIPKMILFVQECSVLIVCWFSHYKFNAQKLERHMYGIWVSIQQLCLTCWECV